MKTMTRPGFAVAAVLLLWRASPARALSVEDQKIVDAGLDALYHGDYDASDKIFEKAAAEHPGDPALSLGDAISKWWRMENDFAPPGSPEEKKFLDADAKAIDDGKRASAKGNDAEAFVCLGAAYGLHGRLEAAQKHWFKAYGDGRRSYRSEERAVKIDPSLDDAYLGLGAFDYYSATLSRFVRFFVFAKASDKSQGLAELDRATRGRFSGVAAKFLLVGINWTFEKKPAEAWTILEELRARFPGSPLIEGMRLIGLYHLRDAAGLEREARIFLENAEKPAPFYRPLDKAVGHYFLGLGLQLSGKYDEAIKEDETALALIPAGHRTRGLPLLFIGECKDSLGKRDEAVASYRQALKEPQFWGVQRYAKFLLSHPFRPGANPLPGRNDELD
jgi:tetratricopeptide (TPR) repeat protein